MRIRLSQHVRTRSRIHTRIHTDILSLSCPISFPLPFRVRESGPVTPLTPMLRDAANALVAAPSYTSAETPVGENIKLSE